MPGSLFDMLGEKHSGLKENLQIRICCVSLAGVFREEEYPQLCDALLTAKEDTLRILVLAEQLHKLGEAGFNFTDYKLLFYVMIKIGDSSKNAKYVNSLIHLRKSEFSLKEHSALFDIISCSYDDDIDTDIIDNFIDACITLKEFMQDLKRSKLKKLFRYFSDMKQAGLCFAEHQVLYKRVVENNCFHNLVTMFNTLYENGMDKLGLEFLSEEIIKNTPYYLNEVLPKIQFFIGENVISEERMLFLEGLKVHFRSLACFVQLFYDIEFQGFNFNDRRRIFDFLVLRDHKLTLLADLFSALKDFGVVYDEAKELFKVVIDRLEDFLDKCWFFSYELINGLKKIKESSFDIRRYIIKVLEYSLKEPELAGLNFEEFALNLIELTKHGQYEKKYKDVLISNPEFAFQIVKAFTLINNERKYFDDNQYFFEFVINNARHADKIVLDLVNFKKLGFSDKDCGSFFERMVGKGYNANDLWLEILSDKESSFVGYRKFSKESLINSRDSHCFLFIWIALKNLGFADEDHNLLFEKIISRQFCSSTLFLAIKSLLENNESNYVDYKGLFDLVIENYSYANDLVQAFLVLYDIGFSHKKHEKLFVSVAKKSYSAKKLALSFSFLKNFGVGSIEYEWLFNLVIDNCFGGGCFHSSFNDLNDAGFSINNPGDRVYYEIVIRDPDMASLILKLNDVFGRNVLLKFYNLSVKNVPMALKIISELNSVNIHYADYSCVYDTFFRKLGDVVLVSDMLSYVCSYANKNDLNQNQEGHGKALIEGIDICQSNIPYGPLDKSQATQLLEKIITQIANTSIDKIEITFNKNTGYVLTIENQPSIYLTLLLNQSNFTHIMLGEETITLLLEKLAKISPLPSCGAYANDFPISPEGLNDIINIYMGECYRNINRLLRGQELDRSRGYKWPGKSGGFLPYFLAGILINSAANQLAEPEKSGIQSKKTVFIRCEQPYPGLFEARIANVKSEPSVLSFARKTARKVFGQYEIVMHYSGPYAILDEIEEEEFLIPAGTQIKYYQDPEGNPQRLFASVVRSPKFKKPDSYWSTVALLHAYEHHLKNEYKRCPDQIKINETKINRPNHGLAHTYRVQEAILSVINYFALHAKDEGFRDFCATISLEDLEYLRVAAAFSVTGRESEVSFHDNKKLYDEFRQASADYLRQFLDQHKLAQNISDDDIERLVDIVRYMGNPNYETKLNAAEVGEAEAEVGEREVRNYMHRILTIAHKLDLLRCYGPDQFKSSMQYVKGLSQASDQQHRDYIALVQHQAALIKAHGDCLYTDVGIDGKFQSVSLGYRPPFDGVSHSIMALQQVSDTVPHLFFQDLPAPEVASQVQCQM